MWLWNVPSPLPSSTEALLIVSFAVAKSSLPSELKSPTATEYGANVAPPPVLKLPPSVNVPSPLPRRMETCPQPASATAKSKMPSPLKSPLATGAVHCERESRPSRRCRFRHKRLANQRHGVLSPGRRAESRRGQEGCDKQSENTERVEMVGALAGHWDDPLYCER